MREQSIVEIIEILFYSLDPGLPQPSRFPAKRPPMQIPMILRTTRSNDVGLFIYPIQELFRKKVFRLLKPMNSEDPFSKKDGRFAAERG